MLSVQVHPSDRQTKYIPAGETGKTEAWMVLEAGTKSRIYASLTPDTTTDNLRQALASGTVADHLACFTPKPGDGIVIPAGTVHSLGDVVVFKVQENSDVTFPSLQLGSRGCQDRPAAGTSSGSSDGLY